MVAKDYSEIEKLLVLERKAEEQEKVIDSFRRVQSGENFSVGDLDNVRRELAEHQKGGRGKKDLNINHAIHSLEHEVGLSREGVGNSKKRLKKRGMDVDRIRRQIRLQNERKKKVELEQGR